MADLTRLKLIEGGNPDKPKRNRKVRRLTPWECRVCLVNEGHATRGLVKVRWGPFEDDQLRITGGQDCWVCAFCMARGRFTQQTS